MITENQWKIELFYVNKYKFNKVDRTSQDQVDDSIDFTRWYEWRWIWRRKAESAVPFVARIVGAMLQEFEKAAKGLAAKRKIVSLSFPPEINTGKEWLEKILLSLSHLIWKEVASAFLQS